MALVTHQLLGIARGSVGDLVYKTRRGKSYVVPKPGRYKKTKCVDSINNRKRFGLSSKFASVINESKYLKLLWYYAKLPGKSAYSKINKYNYQHCGSNFVESDASITPGGKDLQNFNVLLDENTLEFSFNIKQELVDSLASPYLIVSIVYLYQPIAKVTPENREVFITFEQEFEVGKFYSDEINELPLQINKGDLKIVNKYKKAVVFFTLISFENKFKVTEYTVGLGHRVKGFEFYEAEMMALRDLRPKKPEVSDEPINNFRIR